MFNLAQSPDAFFSKVSFTPPQGLPQCKILLGLARNMLFGLNVALESYNLVVGITKFLTLSPGFLMHGHICLTPYNRN